MRAAADRVDAQLREHMAANAIAGPWPTQERILVCINESPAAREAIRVAKRSADRARAEWIALNVGAGPDAKACPRPTRTGWREACGWPNGWARNWRRWRPSMTWPRRS